MTMLKKTVSATLAAVTLASATLVPTTQAQARGGAVVAGVIGGLALGAMAAHAAQPRAVYVVEHRAAPRRKRACGCVHVYHHTR